jgi:hypothetical protein
LPSTCAGCLPCAGSSSKAHRVLGSRCSVKAAVSPGERKGAGGRHALETARAPARPLSGAWLIDGRHLGCSGPRSFSRTIAGGGPPGSSIPLGDESHVMGSAAPGRRRRASGVFGPDGPAQAGHGGDLVKAGSLGRFVRALVATSAGAPVSPAGIPPRACDMRCPSRSGWGEALAASDRIERRHTGLAFIRTHSFPMAPDP